MEPNTDYLPLLVVYQSVPLVMWIWVALKGVGASAPELHSGLQTLQTAGDGSDHNYHAASAGVEQLTKQVACSSSSSSSSREPGQGFILESLDWHVSLKLR